MAGPAGIAIAGLDQGGLLPPYFALGRSYSGKFAHGRTARSITIEVFSARVNPAFQS
jgi:hypothetical protein